ncbi:hypothetical protein H4P1_00023 (plasmid) [Variovorax sp. PBS-H4]|uniref:helix-turn-helix domain-containing protein n=1 Tax=Variovorax sp. PBS-H4 TaxID=434008 RepID=UPI00131804D5|nr:helix-turn-helix transcriptional regulator [Variovorax sp. PBS-H4]VTU41391.1 hypothetical protein H4P1_00023 [Variovorax sp. PBS-H4]
MTATQFEPLRHEDFQKVLGERLRQHRLRRGFSLLGVEAITGGVITSGSLGAYERGSRKIGVFRLVELAQLYQVPVHELLAPAQPSPLPAGRKDTAVQEDLHHEIVLSIAAVHKSVAADIGPLRRLVLAMDPRRQLSFYVITPEQRRHLCILYNKTDHELHAMIKQWGLLKKKSRISKMADRRPSGSAAPAGPGPDSHIYHPDSANLSVALCGPQVLMKDAT